MARQGLEHCFGTKIIILNLYLKFFMSEELSSPQRLGCSLNVVAIWPTCHCFTYAHYIIVLGHSGRIY